MKTSRPAGARSSGARTTGRARNATEARPASGAAIRKTPTIKEFAEAIGVSPTTVSRSITRSGRISDGTRQMVLRRMDELGYTPNLHAQNLVSGRARTIALRMGARLAPTSDLFLIELIRGLQQALQECDYALLLLGRDDELKRWVNSRAVDGIIVVGDDPEDADAARDIVRPNVPCVVVRTVPLESEPHLSSVLIDLSGGAGKAARALVEAGHIRIGFIGSNYSKTVLPGFRDELERLGVPLLAERCIIAGDTLDDGERAMGQLMALAEPPTGIFTRTDELAIGALRAARTLHIDVPGQVSIIGHDDLTFARFVEPPLSTMHVDFDGVGKAVVEVLFELLENPEALVVPHAVETELVLRETVGPLRSRTLDAVHR